MTQFFYFNCIEKPSKIMNGYSATEIKNKKIVKDLNNLYHMQGEAWWELVSEDGSNFEQYFDKMMNGNIYTLYDLIKSLIELSSNLIFIYGDLDEEIIITEDINIFKSLVQEGVSQYPIEFHFGLKQ